ncbi:DUF3047 domain-containing protein [Octadecabacter sp. R77987]|uniref:DUF3047 domain-containing protein n=1 Tax=Octadecabacter sp. R77987 TaxID=3093874 RepID=UPI003671E883
MRSFALALPILLAAAPLAAQSISFNGWTEQRFSLFAQVDYGFSGSRLSVSSDDAASMTYRQLPAGSWGATSASWSWAVSESVPATDLTRKGGDDRNLSLYFVFLPQAEAERIGEGGSIRSLLNNEQARVLVYVWGGAHGRGDVLSSPYLGPRGKTIVRRPSGTGSFSENVDLAGDYARAFGGSAGALVGLAVSADSDDTNSTIRGEISGLSIN